MADVRLIDANALTKFFEEIAPIPLIPIINGFIEERTTIDAVPVVHGRWDKIPNKYMSVASKNGSYSGNATSCSACLEINPNAYKTNYCPNCGAKMDLEVDGDGS